MNKYFSRDLLNLLCYIMSAVVGFPIPESRTVFFLASMTEYMKYNQVVSRVLLQVKHLKNSLYCAFVVVFFK